MGNTASLGIIMIVLGGLSVSGVGQNKPTGVVAYVLAGLLILAGAGLFTRNAFAFYFALAASLLTGQLDSAKRLIERGADVNSRQSGGFAPIHEAALLGRRDLIDLLLDNGAEIGARANDGRNAVSEAERGKHPEIAAYLRTRGGTDPRITADLSAEPTD